MLSQICCKGAIATLAGGKLRVTAPPGVLTAKVQAELRTLVAKIRAAMRLEPGESEAVELCPADGLDRDWRAAAARAQSAFRRNSVEASQDTLEAACWLEFQLSSGWDPTRAISAEDAQNLLQAIYEGRLFGRIGPHGRPVLTARERLDQ